MLILIIAKDEDLCNVIFVLTAIGNATVAVLGNFT